MSMQIRIVDPFTYFVGVQLGLVSDIMDVPDYEILDPTRIDHLKLAFLFPEWPTGRWQGMRKPRAHGYKMTRVKGDNGEDIRMDIDGVEYIVPPDAIAHDRDAPYWKPQPWRRTTPKRETSSQIRHRERAERAVGGAEVAAKDWLA